MEQNLATIAAVHGFSRVGYNFNPSPVTPDYAFTVEIWGEGIGNHGFTCASGATPEKAMEAAIALATEKRAINAPPAPEKETCPYCRGCGEHDASGARCTVCDGRGVVDADLTGEPA